MLVEQRAADNFAWWGYIEEINRTSSSGLSLADFSDSDTHLEQRALKAIRTTLPAAGMSPGSPVDGLSGESFPDE
jgi:hypothetical protein